MGLKSQIDLIAQQKLEVVIRPAEIYAVGNNVLFDIIGGPVWIHALFAVLLADLDSVPAGSDALFEINGVPVDDGIAAAVAGGALGDLMISPLGATGAVVVNVAAANLPDPVALAAGEGKILATNVPGEITLIVGTADFDGACIFYCVYQKMLPQSLVAVA